MLMPRWARPRKLAGFLRLGSISGVVVQMRPPVPSDFGGGGLQSPIYVNGLTGEAWVYVNGQITPLGGGPVLTPEGFGAVGNGVKDDTQAFQAMAAAIRTAGGGQVWLTRGKNYLVFSGATVQTFLMDFSGCTNVHVMGNGATLTSGLVNPAFDAAFFYGSPVNGISVEDLTFIGGNTTLTDVTGEHVIQFGGGSKNIRFSNIVAKNMNAGVQCLDPTTKNFGLVLLNCFFDTVFYPLSTQGVFDVFARYTTRNAGRSYFPTAPCSNHDITVDAQQGLTSTGFASSDCLIKVYADSTKSVADNTIGNIKLNYYSTGRASNAPNGGDAIIQMDIQQLTGVSAAGHFDNININFYIDGAGTSKPGSIFGMDKYDSAGNGDTTARGHTVRGITISGVAKNWNNSGGAGIVFCNTAKGDVWTGDFITGLAVRDCTILGVPPSDAIYANAQGAVAATPFLTLSNVYCDGTITYANRGSSAISESNVRTSSFDATDVSPIAWVPADFSGAGLVFTSVTATISKRGRQVFGQLALTFPVTANGAVASISGLPFSAAAQAWASINTGSAVAKGVAITTTVLSFATGAGAAVTNAQMSGAFVVCNFSYSV